MKNETATQLQRKTTKNSKLSLRLPTAKENADKITDIQSPGYVPLPFPTLAADYIWGKSAWQASLDDFTATFYLLPRVPNFCVPYVGGR